MSNCFIRLLLKLIENVKRFKTIKNCSNPQSSSYDDIYLWKYTYYLIIVLPFEVY